MLVKVEKLEKKPLIEDFGRKNLTKSTDKNSRHRGISLILDRQAHPYLFIVCLVTGINFPAIFVQTDILLLLKEHDYYFFQESGSNRLFDITTRVLA